MQWKLSGKQILNIDSPADLAMVSLLEQSMQQVCKYTGSPEICADFFSVAYEWRFVKFHLLALCCTF